MGRSPKINWAEQQILGIAFDLDGTLRYRQEAISGAIQTVRYLKKRGYKILATSNSSVEPVEITAQCLQKEGFPIERDEIVDICKLTVEVLQEMGKEGQSIFVIGSLHLQEYLRKTGLQVVAEPKKAEILLVGGYGEAYMSDVRAAMEALYCEAQYIAVNKDRLGIDKNGLLPGAGMLVGAIGYVTGVYPKLVIGKPSPRLLQKALTMMNLPPNQCLLVGDSLETDIIAGAAAGMRTALVQTGVTALENRKRRHLISLSGINIGAFNKINPDLIINNVRDLEAYL